MAARRPPRAAVRAAVRACLSDLEPGERVLVALSGGADSLALTAAAVAVSAEMGLLCEAVVIDHQLQPGSGGVAARAAEQARVLGCADARVIAVEVPGGSGSGGVEAAARAVRYAALDAAAGAGVGGTSPVAAILLGHTREDQAETVLLGLARGSGTRSLAGMAAGTGMYRRPLLDLPREVVVAAAWEAAVADPRLEPWTDPHNLDGGFARVRVRLEVLPVLEAALGPGIVEALARTASLARQDADALDAWADRVWEQVRGHVATAAAAPGTPASVGSVGSGGSAGAAGWAGWGSGDPGGLLSPEEQQPSEFTDQSPEVATVSTDADADADADAIAPTTTATPTTTTTTTTADAIALPLEALGPLGVDLPPAIVHRVVRRFLIGAGCPHGSLTAGHIRAVAGLLDPQSPARTDVALPGGRRARREAGAVVVRV